jgi:hypothetical protein
MPLRSGKQYLILHQCQCNAGYYSHQNFDYKCSDCWDYCTKNGIMTGKEFKKRCEEWVSNNMVDEYGRNFILKNKHIADLHLFNFLVGIYENTGKYITAETGLKLYKANPTTNRGHIIGSFVADWWNIKSLKVSEENRWPSYMDCYYGNYSDQIESWSGVNHTSIPPKKPRGKNNEFVNNKIMMGIRYG